MDGDALTWTSANLPTGAVFTDNTDRIATYTRTPTYTQSGTYTGLQFIVGDWQGATVVARDNTNQLSRR